MGLILLIIVLLLLFSGIPSMPYSWNQNWGYGAPGILGIVLIILVVLLLLGRL
jgi:hypothetical protein